jgi:hypothetical protein
MEIFKSIFDYVLFDPSSGLKVNFIFAFGFAFSLLISVLVFYSFYLWVLNYTPPFSVLFLSAFTFFLSFFSYSLYLGSKYLGFVAESRIQYWEEKLKRDTSYLNLAFKESYNEVKNLENENFKDYLSPENGGTLIPITQPKSKIKVAEIYYKRAVEHFKENEKILNLILNPRSTKTPERIKSDMDSFFEKNDIYPLDMGVDIASTDIKTILINQTPRIVLGFKIAIIITYLISLLVILLTIALIALNKN